MTPLPPPFGKGGILGWRLDHRRYQTLWDSGEGAANSGGRWNSKGVRAVYASLDPSTAILEVAVHKGFKALDTVPHVLTSFEVADLTGVHVVKEDDIPNANWLQPGMPSAGQQQFGDSLLAAYCIVVIPSTVSRRSWNVVFDPVRAAGSYKIVNQENFALDTRLHPPGS